MIEQVLCLATAIFFEGRSETLEAQRFIGEVVMNRVEDSRYADNVCSVVFYPNAFSFTHDGKHDKIFRFDNPLEVEARDRAIDLALEIMGEESRSITSTHYHTISVDPFWNSHYELDGQYGTHVFYTNNTPWR
jgi:spore germination cell wall hydrolase CwlJ-like protein